MLQRRSGRRREPSPHPSTGEGGRHRRDATRPAWLALRQRAGGVPLTDGPRSPHLAATPRLRIDQGEYADLGSVSSRGIDDLDSQHLMPCRRVAQRRLPTWACQPRRQGSRRSRRTSRAARGVDSNPANAPASSIGARIRWDRQHARCRRCVDDAGSPAASAAAPADAVRRGEQARVECRRAAAHDSRCGCRRARRGSPPWPRRRWRDHASRTAPCRTPCWAQVHEQPGLEPPVGDEVAHVRFGGPRRDVPVDAPYVVADGVQPGLCRVRPGTGDEAW